MIHLQSPTKFLLALTILLTLSYSQNIELITTHSRESIATNGVRNTSYYQAKAQLDCGMPELSILKDWHHTNYSIVTTNVSISSIQGQWSPIQAIINCDLVSNCVVNLNNLCNKESQKHQINWIKAETSIGQIEYLVDCDPDNVYKPFQIGLFLLIMLATLTLTLSSIYSRAWSYYGYGYTITKRIVVLFNILLLLVLGLGYIAPDIVSKASQIFGSLIGAFGVTVCSSQIIWLTKNKNYRKKIFKKFRLIDLISVIIGLLFIPLYWLLNGQWLVNDIMAICSIIALMKLLKIQSLSVGVFLLMSLLVIEMGVGIFVHYVIEISYNNYIINLFQNPIVLVLPSITRQLYRRCAWLPITAILFPGLLLSYLRRFDKSRSTFLYFLIGLATFYVGSIIWMVIDLQTVHSLPFSIVSQPLTILILCVQSFKRNEFVILWRGTFHDQQLSEGGQEKDLKQTQIVSPTAYSQLTSNLRISDGPNSSDNYRILQ